MFLAAIITFEKLMPVAIFGLFAIVSYWILTLLAGRRTRAPSASTKSASRLRRGEKAQKQDGAVSKMLEKASPLAKPLQPKTEKEVGRLKQRLGYAGFRNESAVSVFLGMKFIGLMLGLFVCGGPILILNGATQNTLMYVVLLAGGLFYLPDAVIWFLGKSRKQAIFLDVARCARPVGRLRRSRSRPRPGHAQGQRGIEAQCPRDLRGVQPLQLPIADG